MLNGLDLFSGIGGISVALHDWVRPVAYVEIDPYCRGVLLSRISDATLVKAPIWDDIRSFPSSLFEGGVVDIITAGFPCQGISIAGLGKGLADERSGLFFEILRISKEVKPIFIFLENVPAITGRGGLRVVREITEMGYDCRWCVISAASVGAPHKRDRWFLLAHANGNRIGGNDRKALEGEKEKDSELAESLCKDVADSKSERCEKGSELRSDVPTERFIGSDTEMANTGCFAKGCCQRDKEGATIHSPKCGRFWEVEPSVGRVVDGLPFRVDRIRALGNSVVPSQAKEAFKTLMGLKI